MTNKAKMNNLCKKCGKKLSADEKKSAKYCSRCMIEQAEKYVPEEPKMTPIKREKRSRV